MRHLGEWSSMRKFENSWQWAFLRHSWGAYVGSLVSFRVDIDLHKSVFGSQMVVALNSALSGRNPHSTHFDHLFCIRFQSSCFQNTPPISCHLWTSHSQCGHNACYWWNYCLKLSRLSKFRKCLGNFTENAKNLETSRLFCPRRDPYRPRNHFKRFLDPIKQ